MKSKTAWAPKRGTSLLAGFAVLAAASLCLLLPAAATATPPTAISFSNARQVISATPGPGNQFQTVSTGTSIASGAINDSFTLVDQAAVIQGSHANKNTNYGTIHITSVLSGDDGTITMDIQGQFVSSNPDGTETIEGHWTIVSGTGSYTDLHGTGTDDTTIYPATETIADTLTGYAHYEPN